VRHQLSAKDGGVCVTRARTTQRWTALMIVDDHTACEALIAAKAALDIQDVSFARLFACPVTLILCLHAHQVNIVICNPSMKFSSLGDRGD
jgi:predicted LPLAT superfamily acyltransferase